MKHDRFNHWMYVWAVEMASVWDTRGDLDGYCYWWAWRIDERWDEEERTSYEAWKYEQLKNKPVYVPGPIKSSRAARSHKWVSPSKKRKQ